MERTYICPPRHTRCMSMCSEFELLYDIHFPSSVRVSASLKNILQPYNFTSQIFSSKCLSFYLISLAAFQIVQFKPLIQTLVLSTIKGMGATGFVVIYNIAT